MRVRDSGVTWRALYMKYDHDSCTWKTPRFSLVEDLEWFSPTLPRWGSMLGGALWEQTRSAPPTSGTGSGYSLPTPVKYDADGGHGATDNYHGLGWQARYGDQGFGPSGKYEQGYVPLYPTPLAADGRRASDAGPNIQRGIVDGTVHDNLRRRIRREEMIEAGDTDFMPPEHAPGKATSSPVARRTWSTPTVTQPKMPPGTLEARMRDGKHGGSTSVPLVESLQREQLAAHRSKEWPTPLAGAAKMQGPGFDIDQPRNGIAAAVRRRIRAEHPTPTSSNGLRGSSSSEHFPGMWQSPGHPEYGELSPEWVEWLMGWPRGWTSLRPMDPADLMAWENLQAGIDGSAVWWHSDPSDDPASGISKTVPKGTPQENDVRTSRIAALGNGQVSAACAGGFMYLWNMDDPV